MNTTGNTILITGGGTGIGRGLAEAFHQRGNQVIISGRTQKSLDAATAANPGMQSLTVDMADAASIGAFAAKLTTDFPSLNVVVHNAGIMRPEKLLAENADLTDMEATVATNLIGPMRLTVALLPLLQKQPSATVMTVSSGLAFVPLAMTPTYSATKAAIHSYSQSLRYQLQDTSIRVIELIPPYVQTGLLGEHQENDPRAMPLAEFINEVMTLLETRPDATEITVQRVLRHTTAAEGGREKYEQFFTQLNNAMSGR